MVCESWRSKLEPYALLILRVSTGIIMAVHGWQKFSDIPKWTEQLTKMGIPFPELNAYLSIAAELLGGLGLIVGLLTPLAALGVVSTMAVAVFVVHFDNGLLAKDGGFEYPMTLMFVGLYFMMKGAGCLSLDALFCKKKNVTIP